MRINICNIGVAEGAEKEKGAESLFLKMTENFPNLGRKMNIPIQDPQRTPARLNIKSSSTRHVMKLSKDKDKEDFENNKKRGTHHIQGALHKVMSDFTAETLQAGTEWDDIFKILKGKKITIPSKSVLLK